jgi:hypothetical protein
MDELALFIVELAGFDSRRRTSVTAEAFSDPCRGDSVSIRFARTDEGSKWECVGRRHCRV